MKVKLPAGLLTLVLLVIPAAAQTTWLVNNTTNISGHAVKMLGQPRVVATAHGDAVQFNGVSDGLVVSNNPLAGLTNFTVELIFKQDPLTVAKAREPRIVHVQSGTPPDHRLTLEARVNTNTSPHNYHLDTFLRFGDGDYRRTLLNENHPHPVGEWAHLAVTYDGTTFCNYFNGQMELSKAMKGMFFTNTGATWIGQRANNTGYFEGAVLALRITPRVLGTNEFWCDPVRYNFSRSAITH
jgi:hypothetical protein